MSTHKQESEPVVLGVEYSINVLPQEFRHAVRFAAAHERMILVGYVQDEKKVYLMSVETNSQ